MNEYRYSLEIWYAHKERSFPRYGS